MFAKDTEQDWQKDGYLYNLGLESKTAGMADSPPIWVDENQDENMVLDLEDDEEWCYDGDDYY